MEITLKQLVDGEQALANLAQSRQPVKVAYRIGKIIRKVEPELKDFYAARQTLLEKYGTKQENGQWRIEKDQIAALEEELRPLLEETVTIDAAPVNVEELQGEISAAELEKLMGWCVVDNSA